MKSLFFVHIPKTAGTSLRRGACKIWGKRKILFDYGDTIATSDDINRLVYQEEDIFALKNFLVDKKIRFLSGHKPVKYLYPIFPSNNIFTFVREPVARVLSHYNFVCQQENYNHGIEQFCMDPENRDIQSKYLRDYPPELMGFIGLSERYSESLTLLNELHGINIPELKLNTSTQIAASDSGINQNQSSGSRNKTNTPDNGIDKITRELILQNNQQDQQLYNLASRLFEDRVRCQAENTNYTYGKVQKLRPHFIEGWAAVPTRNKPVTIEVSVDGEPVAELEANQFRAPLKHRNSPRDGYVGFRYSFNSPLEDGTIVRCRPVESSQILIGPLKVSDVTTEGQPNPQLRAA